ncbi:fibronectin type III domain-containing protein [Archangium violaceum]|uniref:fibronectin type III domain-containing protein n=1 Tax=Archangium violaceum TaxID=83451 RepID=UPI00193B6A9D|nr:fibronectin type III domain-containing protein [Archangium violaceum]QRK11911.1 fibronectin type III domain-containing protein [Archangium violaceum]
MSKASRGLLLLVSLGLGCDGEEVKPPVVKPPVEDKSVRIRSVWSFHTASGVEERPDDFSNPVELFLLEDGAFKAFPGALAGPGEYVFADVPDGTYYLKRGSSYTVTSARRLDWSPHRLGRVDAQELPESSTPTQVRLDIDGLEPWADYGARPWPSMQLVSGELDVAGYINADEVMRPGMTSVRGELVSYDNVYSRLYRFEQERGDRAWVTQFVSRKAGALADGSDLNYSAVARSLHLEPFSYDGTQPLPVSGTFQELPSKQLTLNWALSSFASHATDTHPAATFDRAIFTLSPLAHGAEDARFMGYSGDLLSFDLPRGYDEDISATFSYGNPFPSTWGEFAWLSVPFRVQYSVPGATRPLVIDAWMEAYEPMSVLAAGPVQPRTFPPRGLKLDGEDAYATRSLAVGSHVISWQPPASGQVSVYALRLRRYEVAAEGGLARNVESVYFTLAGGATSVLLPPDVLKPASHYILQLTAMSAPGYSPENTSAGSVLPYAHASALSGILSTP